MSNPPPVDDDSRTSVEKIADFSTGWVKEIGDLKYKPEKANSDTNTTTAGLEDASSEGAGVGSIGSEELEGRDQQDKKNSQEQEGNAGGSRTGTRQKLDPAYAMGDDGLPSGVSYEDSFAGKSDKKGSYIEN